MAACWLWISSNLKQRKPNRKFFLTKIMKFFWPYLKYISSWRSISFNFQSNNPINKSIRWQKQGRSWDTKRKKTDLALRQTFDHWRVLMFKMWQELRTSPFCPHPPNTAMHASPAEHNNGNKQSKQFLDISMMLTKIAVKRRTKRTRRVWQASTITECNHLWPWGTNAEWELDSEAGKHQTL